MLPPLSLRIKIDNQSRERQASFENAHSSPLAGSDVCDGGLVVLVGGGSSEMAEIVGGLRGEVTLRSLQLGASLGSVQIDLGALHAGTGDSVGLLYSWAGSVCIAALDADRGHLESDRGRVDRHASLAGSVAELRSVNASSTAESAGGEVGAVDVEVFLGALGLEGALGSEGVVLDVRLVVAERSVLIE